ncbi:DNA polymerase [Vibrio parahaemolyticus]|uniref:DNA polymerase n=1 Tax=Vibrio parahaemolyticus TaxID=670 RepID=UPI00046ED366|nr:DNA polymerase [Vibrio parahaemolyticus]MDF5409660.1 DNA polymerase [Vibrio parahaemolyticus]MDG2657448.1 DNA polymerase [Vibrio parahaemolyticus]MDG2825158.1 DNA polymerase [Vibrio parahaemolyticus]MDG2844855.1 DNA polymerase [Vibrio parahaemolyticus]MDG2860860.1 DNA polymerase [Vibrio parahaemolyticus]
MNLLPGTELYFAPTKNQKVPTLVLPKNPSFTSGETTLISTQQGLCDFIDLVLQLPICHVGIECKHIYGTSHVTLPNGYDKYDISAIQPTELCLTLCSGDVTSIELHAFIIDLASDIETSQLQVLFDLPVAFVAYDANKLLHCLWAIELIEPRRIWDILIAEKARYLGLHQFDKRQEFNGLVAKIEAKDRFASERSNFYSLRATAARYGLESPLTDQTEALCEEVAKLYMLQVQATVMQGIHSHLLEVEMPWIITNAAMEKNGVLVSREQCEKTLSGTEAKLAQWKSELEAYGLVNPNSTDEKIAFFNSLGMLHHFKEGNGYSFERESLYQHRDLHQAIELLRKYTSKASISKDVIFQPGLVGADGRIHPVHKHLDTVTGRQATIAPNILGLPADLRPIVIAPECYGIGEVDLAQIEVAITAAVYNDVNLIEKYNAGDLYSALAQEFYQDELPEEHKHCSLVMFKEHHADKRHVMKQCTLGLIYGITAFGLAKKLKVSEFKARQLMDEFLAMFPTLEKAMHTAPQYGVIRGYVSTATGLQRQRTENAERNRSEKNWMINMPVQGTAAALFKMAGNRLHQLYKRYDAKLIVALHDAFVFEAPLDNLEEVAALTSQVMIQVIQEKYPQLNIRTDINITSPNCWNKDGNGASIDGWLSR